MIPNTKISETIIEFGRPVLSQLPPNPTKDEYETAIGIILTVWNAAVVDLWNDTSSNEKSILEELEVADKKAWLEVKRLFKRKKTKFGSDPRGVGEHWLREQDGEFVFGCDARLNVENAPASGTQH